MDSKEAMIPESQLRSWFNQALSDALLQVVAQLGAPPTIPITSHTVSPRRKYLPTNQAWRELGYTNREALYDAIYHGLLRVGHEVQDRRRKNGVNACYYFDIEACLKRLQERPEKRK